MADIVIAEFMDEAAVAALAADFHVLYDKGLVDRPADLAREIKAARALIVRNRTQVRGSLLAAGDALEVVGRLGVGLDNIDTAACSARGITVIPATGANDISVAEWTLTTILMLMRGAYAASTEVAAGLWPRERLMGREIHGKTLGLVGFGSIARETTPRAQAFGMTVIAADPHIAPSDPVWSRLNVRPVSLDTLVAEADAISLHVPLTETTRGLFNAARIAAMKPGAVLVNAARGGVVDERAAFEAAAQGRIGGVALDVFETEPLPAITGFAPHPNIILTPHIAGVTRESNVRVSGLIAEKVAAALRDRG
ncbi:MAG: hydroxyacid dehydrogenase [Alphaproteobacteria bacterium]